MKPIKIFTSKDYNYVFNTETGAFARWGATKAEDPDFSPYGPEILDIEISTVCHQGCSFCLPPESLIITPSGPKPISEIKQGDIVFGFDETRKEQQVDQVFVRMYSDDLIVVETESNVLRLTPNHSVHTKRGWVPAEDLCENDEIIEF